MTREFTGYWHAPNSKVRYGGTAIHKEESISLVLWKFEGGTSYEILHGETIEGINVTALLCRFARTRHPNTETLIAETTFEISALLIGIHISNLSDLEGMNIALKFNGLHEWIAYGLKGELPGQIEVPEYLGRYIPFSLNNEWRTETSCFTYTKKSNYVFFFSQEKNIPGSFLNYSYFAELWMRDFLSFASQQKINTNNAFLRTPRLLNSIEMIKPHFNSGCTYSDALILLQFHTIKDRMPSIWTEWCRVEAEYRPLIHHNVKQLSSNQLDISEIFLDLAITIEFYGRKHFSLDQSADFMFIIKDVWHEQPKSIRDILGKKSSFADSARLFRNSCAHISPEKPFNRYNLDEMKQKQLSEIHLYWKLNVLCKSIILTELGFTHDEIDLLTVDQQTSFHFHIPNISSQQLL